MLCVYVCVGVIGGRGEERRGRCRFHLHLSLPETSSGWGVDGVGRRHDVGSAAKLPPSVALTSAAPASSEEEGGVVMAVAQAGEANMG
jgi:hypothetical protein